MVLIIGLHDISEIVIFLQLLYKHTGDMLQRRQSSCEKSLSFMSKLRSFIIVHLLSLDGFIQREQAPQ